MPEEGFKSITISKTSYELLERLAKEEDRSVANMNEQTISFYANKKVSKK